MSDHESFEQKLKEIVKASVGAIATAVEKSKEAITEFVSKENMQHLSEKGEQALKQVQSLGEDAAKKVKDVWEDSGIAASLTQKPMSPDALAQLVSALNDEQREAFRQALAKHDEAQPAEDGSLQSDESFEYGKTVPSPSVQEEVAAAQPTRVVDPDDTRNTNKMQINDVNDHIPQSVPPNY